MIAMLERAVAAGGRSAWFTADEAYGQAGYLRRWLEDRDVSYVMATRCDDRMTTRADRIVRADDPVIALPPPRPPSQLGAVAVLAHTGVLFIRAFDLEQTWHSGHRMGVGGVIN